MLEMCVLFNNVLLVALQTHVGFEISVEEFSVQGATVFTRFVSSKFI